MPGSKDTYTFETADVVVYYAPQRWCRIAIWLPEGHESLTDIPVYVIAHGGGWIVTPSLVYLNHEVDRQVVTETNTSTVKPDTWLANGWAIAYMEYPIAANTIAGNRAWPCARYPYIPRMMGRAIQFLKTHAQDGYITGSRKSTLSVSDSRYIIDGGSAGAIMAMWVALQPTGALPFYKDRPQSLDDLFTYRYSHRVGGVVCYEGACDFTKFSSAGISASAVPYFGFSEDFKSSPRFSDVPYDVKLQASTLPLVQSNYAENKNVGIYVQFGDVSLGPTASFLGSGTTVVLSSVSGTPVVGDTVEEYNGSSVTASLGGTVKYWNSTSSTVYIERSSRTRFTAARTLRKVGGSGWSGTIVSMTGNDNRLAFLDLEAAQALYDADDNEIPDLTSPHENIFGAWLWNALVENDERNGVTSSKHNYIISDPYIAQNAGLSAKYTAWVGSDDPVRDWYTNQLGITT